MSGKKLTVIKKTGDFRRAYQNGKSAATPNIVVYARPNGMETSRFGFSVSKKTGNAVTRNKIRRRFKEILRLNLRFLDKPVSPPRDFVLIARSGAGDVPYEKLKRDVLALLKRLTR